MNVFRLVLCLAGLAIYFVIRQSLQVARDPEPLPPKAKPVSTSPQTTPHHEILPPDTSYVHRVDDGAEAVLSLIPVAWNC